MVTKEEAMQEVNKAFEPAFANYIITALTEGTTVSDRCKVESKDRVKEGMSKDEAKSYLYSIAAYLGYKGEKSHNHIVGENMCEAIKALEQESETWSLDDAREDFMHDVYTTLDFLPTNEEADGIIDSFDRVTSNIRKDPVLNKIREELIQSIQNGTLKIESGREELFHILDQYSVERRDKE